MCACLRTHSNMYEYLGSEFVETLQEVKWICHVLSLLFVTSIV